MSRPIHALDDAAHLNRALERLLDHVPKALVEGGPLWEI